MKEIEFAMSKNKSEVKKAQPSGLVKNLPQDPMVWRLRIGGFLLSVLFAVIVLVGLLSLGQNELVRTFYWFLGLVMSIIGASLWTLAIQIGNRSAKEGKIGDIELIGRWGLVIWILFRDIRDKPLEIFRRLGRLEAVAQAILLAGLLTAALGVVFYFGYISI